MQFFLTLSHWFLVVALLAGLVEFAVSKIPKAKPVTKAAAVPEIEFVDCRFVEAGEVKVLTRQEALRIFAIRDP